MNLMNLRTPQRLLRLVVAISIVFALVMAVGDAGPLLAQETGLPGNRVAGQSLRPYWHVFAAYTIVIALIGGWAFSIARRLRGLEERLVD